MLPPVLSVGSGAGTDFILLQVQCRRALCLGKVQGQIAQLCPHTGCVVFQNHTEFPPDFPGKGVLRVNSKAWS